LIGRNFAGYGIAINQNFVKLLENSSAATAPTNPLIGQLWWDSTNRHLTVWQGTGWKVISSSLTGTNAPQNPVTGDFWWNTQIDQLSVYSGSQWIGVGPTILPGQANTAIYSALISDSLSQSHYIGNLLVNNRVSAVFSGDNFSYTPSPSYYGLTTINPGLNMINGLAVTTPTLYAGNAFVGNLTISGNLNLDGEPLVKFDSIESNVMPTANLTYNLGSATNWWNNIYGTSIHAQYADLAERFESDAEYEAGTVVELGGSAEITAAIEELSEEVFGVISTQAAFVMNSKAGDDSTHPPVAVQGRVPVKVIGKVRKGDRLVSAGNGIARTGSKSEITTWNVIGRALENKDTLDEGVIEAVVKINS
jgi:hypothetical protein